MSHNITEKKLQKNHGKVVNISEKHLDHQIFKPTDYGFKTFLVHLFALEGKNKHLSALQHFLCKISVVYAISSYKYCPLDF